MTAELLNESYRSLDQFVRELWDRALLWRSGDGQHVVRAVSQVLGHHPAGLGPPFSELPGSTPEWSASPKALDAVVASAPAGARNILDMLTWGPPIATLSPRGRVAAAGAWLLSHQLLSALSNEQVALPR